ncbi:O-antigen ligase [Allocatelliglobosispora scoriae]|uniref:O-antigen ligase n=1 Tax=Allocatelliglobosispora scoriae TaxID=643052 RepID=A0A841BY94_9ACTN|nr:O-antigen ligase family protein [Allocatelliglobosispora scoriae]MBB5872089.1 O-antigen ligase [Allocatelliglobosispora scoriae]
MTATGIGAYADFDPSEVSEGTYASRMRRHVIDVASVLNLLIILLMLLPSRLIVPQMSNFGRPALVLGMLLMAIWVVARVHPGLTVRGHQPMRWVSLIFVLSLLASYVAGGMRGLPPLESSGADRELILWMIFLGVVLAAADGIATMVRFEDLVRMLVWCGGLMGLIGNLQFALNFDVTQYMKFPGLQLIAELEGLEARSGFYRVASTATHYIEFSVVMAMLLPLGIHLVRFGKTRPLRQAAGAASLLMASAVPITLSRSGMLAALAAAVILFPFWPNRTRFNIGVVSLGMIAGMALVRPGFIGTLLGLFSNMSDDPSIEGRTSDYDIVFSYVREAPWFGRGYGTFIPKLYIILDNQWLGQLVSGGYVGLFALALLHITAIVLAIFIYRRSTTPEGKHLALCFVAVQVIAMLAGATFDSFGFTTFSTTFALLTGMTGALWRLTHPDRKIRHTVHGGLG